MKAIKTVQQSQDTLHNEYLNYSLTRHSETSQQRERRLQRVRMGVRTSQNGARVTSHHQEAALEIIPHLHVNNEAKFNDDSSDDNR